MKGRLYGIGVGPGDPELMTIKAVRLMKESDLLALPGTDRETCVAYQIARGICGELAEKEWAAVPMPMTMDPEILEFHHAQAAKILIPHLEAGKQVAFLTLGDPTVYSTYLYVHKRLAALGYETEIVSGIPSFCAAAARLGVGLAEMGEPIHVIPAARRAGELDELIGLPGTKIFMKAGKKMKLVKESIERSGQQVMMVENCGMTGEAVYKSAEEIPEDAGYYSLLIVKE